MSVLTETPIKRARPRPMSEDLLGRSRPKVVYDDGDGECLCITNTCLTFSLINRRHRIQVIVECCDKRSGPTHQ